MMKSRILVQSADTQSISLSSISGLPLVLPSTLPLQALLSQSEISELTFVLQQAWNVLHMYNLGRANKSEEKRHFFLTLTVFSAR